MTNQKPKPNHNKDLEELEGLLVRPKNKLSIPDKKISESQEIFKRLEDFERKMDKKFDRLELLIHNLRKQVTYK